MTLTFKCGHCATFPRDVKETPTCPQCGERIVKTVKNATPRFSGACQGPLVEKS